MLRIVTALILCFLPLNSVSADIVFHEHQSYNEEYDLYDAQDELVECYDPQTIRCDQVPPLECVLPCVPCRRSPRKVCTITLAICIAAVVAAAAAVIGLSDGGATST